MTIDATNSPLSPLYNNYHFLLVLMHNIKILIGMNKEYSKSTYVDGDKSFQNKFSCDEIFLLAEIVKDNSDLIQLDERLSAEELISYHQGCLL